MAEDSCIGMAALILIILLIAIFSLHLLVIYPYLVKLAKIRIERFANFDESIEELKNELDDTPQSLVNSINRKFKYTPEKLMKNTDLMKEWLNDEDWKNYDFVKSYNNS